MTDINLEATRDGYVETLRPLFLPDDPVANDIVNYFASLLRVVGMEDKGWDPYLESRTTLEDINAFLQIDLPENRFPNKEATTWRMGLLMYSHIVEMDAPYEVITNLLRFRLGKGYSPNPFYALLNDEQKKRFKRGGLYPKQKIEIIKQLSEQANLKVGSLFGEFYDARLRNAISHSDYILTDEEFRCRGGAGGLKAFKIPLADLNSKITKAKAYIGAVFGLDVLARQVLANHKGKAIPYDPLYKGLMEVLVGDDGLMCGFKVHWPNGTESFYRRTPNGIDMTNCMLDLKNSTISLLVGSYARQPGQFSPLVESGEPPRYTPLEGSRELPQWPS